MQLFNGNNTATPGSVHTGDLLEVTVSEVKYLLDTAVLYVICTYVIYKPVYTYIHICTVYVFV